MNTETTQKDTEWRHSIPAEDLDRLLAYIDGIDFGSVTIIIQDGKVLQIEKHEKIRLR
ncbi:MAG: YezD family protein [Clostridiales Family XIII bacterium]|jgi:hypothetical protein|nr:YezD family protein [Clostridiales Family XIII bacterium]